MTIFKEKLKFPKKKTEWLIIGCWFTYIVTEVLVRAFLQSDLESVAQPQPFHIWFIRLLRFSSLAGGISSSIIIGIHSVRQQGYSHRGLIVPLFGIGFSIFVTFISIFIYLKVSEIQQGNFEMEKRHLNSLKTLLNYESLPPSDRSKISRRYAKWLYIFRDEAAHYVTLEGRKKLYEPTEKDKQWRKEKILIKKLFNRAIKDKKQALVIWPTLTLLSIGIGLFSPVRNDIIAKRT